jgi:acyl-CoA ligase (AMP-forming) (exosortase A-associated)
MPRLLQQIFLDPSKQSPDSPAIIHKKEIWSYSQLHKLVTKQAYAFLALNLKPKQRVAVYLPKQIETVTSFFAITQAGGVFVPVNPTLKALQVIHILQDCDVQILVTAKSRLRGLIGYISNCPELHTVVLVEDTDTPEFDLETLRVINWQDFNSLALQNNDIPGMIDTDMAAILYTSGSTGKPKGVVLSHQNFLAGAKSVSEYLNLTRQDRLLAVLPFSFDYGLNQLTSALLKGACCVLLDYLLPQDVITTLVKQKITGLAAVPPLWIQLGQLEWPESINQYLRYMTNSGGKMPHSVLEKIRQKVPNGDFFLMYGLTEAFRSTYLHPEQLDKRPNSIGKAIPNAEVTVVREDGSLCAPNEPGELVHRGSLVTMGYWNDPVKTAERFKPAPMQLKGLPIPEIAVWSGDTVTMDEEGYLYFVGRKDNMIKTSGYRVSHTEIEEIVYASGLIKEAAAIGIDHKTLGQAILLVISVATEQNFDIQNLVKLCKIKLPNYMVPAKIEILPSLPKNPNGKIDRTLLAQQYAGTFESV